ncbi:MAG: 4-hydroxy-tetrahydrodipicolinate reductase [Kordiimonadaceae bacterium]|nr:4-hydroxy-tetrahydrodipicolinate reductase [Kordiimonadaceae bacterium]MBT6032246.1 4-hydroxy-tetrahydrodipicolinate reductase [Kordiimonadaceae bacterium]
MKIGIIGCLGRMGQALTAAVIDHENAALIGGSEMSNNDQIGQLMKHPGTGVETNIKITHDAEELIKTADVVLDFTCPTATILHAALAEKHKTSLVIGTTGLDQQDEETLQKSANSNSIVYASNFSAGVNLLFYLTRKTASILEEDFDIEIIEMHHRDKVDAPSGTALSLGKEAAAGRGKPLADIMDRARDGITEKRKKGNIGFASLRGGNVAGEHTVSFNADDERIELTHKAGDRAIFARGAVKAALWVHGKKPGLYDMFDVLGLEK